MRFKNLCVYIDITDGARPKFRARCFCFNGKTEVAWGRTIAAYPRLDRVRLEIEKFFRGKTSRVFICYDPLVDRVDEMLEFIVLTNDTRWTPLDQPLAKPTAPREPDALEETEPVDTCDSQQS